MKRIVFLFPGVGSQYVGMSKSLYDNFKIFRETIEEAGEVLKMDLPGMCFLPTKKEELNKLENSQSALLAFSTASYRVYMQEIGIQPHYCMGHSLGEYSALCSAGVIQFPDALRLVKQRGLIVNEVAASIEGTMAWVVNLETKVVEDVCRETFKEGQEIYVSAYDSPNQTSISGRTETLMKVARELEKKGAIVYPLKLGGPFHCPLMKEAAEKMISILQQYKYGQPKCSVIANRNALPYKDAESVVDNLSLQLISPIRWKTSVDYLKDQGVEIAIEMGPKNVLKFLVEKNTDSIGVYTTDNDQDLKFINDELIIGKEEHLSIIGKCLGAAVSTKNRNSNSDEYEEKIVKPYKRVESFYKKFAANGHCPGENHVKEAIQMLRSVLAVKKVPQQEQKYWFNHVLGNKMIKGEPT